MNGVTTACDGRAVLSLLITCLTFIQPQVKQHSLKQGMWGFNLIQPKHTGIPLRVSHRDTAEQFNRLHSDKLFYPMVSELWDTLYIKAIQSTTLDSNTRCYPIQRTKFYRVISAYYAYINTSHLAYSLGPTYIYTPMYWYRPIVWTTVVIILKDRCTWHFNIYEVCS
jgi:hypothetical protein